MEENTLSSARNLLRTIINRMKVHVLSSYLSWLLC